MKKKLTAAGAILVAILAAIQFVPVTRENPPSAGLIPAPPEIKALLERACFDCHSHETVWPRYSRIAPVSWMVAHDVKEGRGRMNFSTWHLYEPGTRKAMLTLATREIDEGQMPPAPYLLMHEDARLTDQEKATLTTWMKSEAAK